MSNHLISRRGHSQISAAITSYEKKQRGKIGLPGREDMECNGKVKEEQQEVLESMETSDSVPAGVYDRSQLPDLLRVYYTWLFPYDRYFEWLQYGTEVKSPSNNSLS